MQEQVSLANTEAKNSFTPLTFSVIYLAYILFGDITLDFLILLLVTVSQQY